MYYLILIQYEGAILNVIICFKCQGHLEVKIIHNERPFCISNF